MGDGNGRTGQTVGYLYASSGSWSVRLTVKSGAKTASVTHTVTTSGC
jgi:hypothetical protein